MIQTASLKITLQDVINVKKELKNLRSGKTQELVFSKNDREQIKVFRNKTLKTLFGYWWFFLFLIMISTSIFIAVSGYISGVKLKMDLDGKIFSNVEEINYEGVSIYISQIQFSGKHMDIKTTVINSEDWKSEGLQYYNLGDGKRYYSAWKDLPGKNGNYWLFWSQGTPFVNYRAKVMCNEKGEIIGIQQGSVFYYLLERPLLPD